MINLLESSSSSEAKTENGESPGRLKVGVIAAASLLAGGLVAAWWYRKTLTMLRQAEKEVPNPHFGIPEDDWGNGA